MSAKILDRDSGLPHTLLSRSIILTIVKSGSRGGGGRVGVCVAEQRAAPLAAHTGRRWRRSVLGWQPRRPVSPSHLISPKPPSFAPFCAILVAVYPLHSLCLSLFFLVPGFEKFQRYRRTETYTIFDFRLRRPRRRRSRPRSSCARCRLGRRRSGWRKARRSASVRS